jgi:acyl-coenzyme A synthetase/AMP-(fatty) acid ligase
MMRAAGETEMGPIAGRLRCITGGGEPLNAEVSRWGEKALGRPINEVYGRPRWA